MNDAAMKQTGADRPQSAATDVAMAATDPVLSGTELLLGVGVLGLATFLVVIDLTIVNVILPAIGASYAAAPHEVTMGITSFAIAQAVIMPLTGWLSARLGVVRLFLLSLAGFGVTSLACGLAPTLELFLLARVVQGFSCGPIVPLVQTLLQRSVPKDKLPAAYGFWTVMLSAGPLVGPMLGGIMADTIGWQWGFYLNVPIAVVCVVVAARVFSRHDTPTVKAPVDLVGLALLVAWVAPLQFVLDKGRELDWFGDPLIVGLSALSGLSFVAFLIWEFTDDRPLIDFSVFRYRSFLFGTPVSAISFSSHVVATLMLTLWLQIAMGYTATWAGYAVAVMGMSALLAGPAAAILTRRIDSRLVVTLGMSVTCAGLWWRASFYGDVDFRLVVIAQLITGFSSTFAMGPIFALVMSDIPQAKLPAAAGLLTFVRMLTVGVLTATVITAWQNGQSQSHNDIAATLNTQAAGMAALPADAMPANPIPGDALAIWNDVVNHQSLHVANGHVLHWLVLFVAIGPLLIWLCPRPDIAAAAPKPARPEGEPRLAADH